MKDSEIVHIPLPTVRRMPAYLRILHEFQQEKIPWISTTDFSMRLSLKPIQVRKDMAYTGLQGKPRLGFEVNLLRQAIEEMLGWDSRTEAVLVGSGALGSALLGYKGFSQHGLKIVAAFDSNPAIIGKQIHGLKIQGLSDLAPFIKKNSIPIGIITVPESYGQEIADKLVEAGIRGIWNFSPVKLNVPHNVMVQKEDLASGLAVLSVMLNQDAARS